MNKAPLYIVVKKAEEHDHERIKSIIQQANGNVGEFIALYRKRFNFVPDIIDREDAQIAEEFFGIENLMVID